MMVVCGMTSRKEIGETVVNMILTHCRCNGRKINESDLYTAGLDAGSSLIKNI